MIIENNSKIFWLAIWPNKLMYSRSNLIYARKLTDGRLLFLALECFEQQWLQGDLKFIVDVAHYEMESKPAGAVSMLHLGIPEHHCPFWKGFSFDQLYSLYKAISATPKSVLPHQMK